MATKRGRSGSKAKSTKPAARGGTKARAVKPAAKADGKAAPARPAAAVSAPSVLERAETLRDAIQRSKLTAPDPWAYTAKARGWGQRAQALVDRVARDGDTSAARQALDKLSAEVEGDRDFKEARRLF